MYCVPADRGLAKPLAVFLTPDLHREPMRQDSGSTKRGHLGRTARPVRPVNPFVSAAGEDALDRYGTYLRNEEGLSDLRHFAAWCEATWDEGQESGQSFTSSAVSTPTITRYRSYLQTVLRLKPASINCSLVTLKRYFSWAVDMGLVTRNPATVVKLVPQEEQPPRHLTDAEEEALVAVVAYRSA